MASQVQRTRDEFKTGIAIYFRFVFADAKVLLKILRKLASALCGLGEELEIVSRSMLDQIELLDMHLGTLLQEGDRIIRAMTRGSARTGPLVDKSRSMRKDLIKHDLAPQMLEFAENIGQIKRRVRAMTQRIAAERAGASDSP
jgi:hypothetical protein